MIYRSPNVQEIDDINYLKLQKTVTSVKGLKRHLKSVLSGSYNVLPRLHSFWGQNLELTPEVWSVLLSKKLTDRKKHVCLVLVLAERALNLGKLACLVREEFLSIW